eukprot:g30969.t1
METESVEENTDKVSDKLSDEGIGTSEGEKLMENNASDASNEDVQGGSEKLDTDVGKRASSEEKSETEEPNVEIPEAQDSTEQPLKEDEVREDVSKPEEEKGKVSEIKKETAPGKEKETETEPNEVKVEGENKAANTEVTEALAVTQAEKSDEEAAREASNAIMISVQPKETIPEETMDVISGKGEQEVPESTVNTPALRSEETKEEKQADDLQVNSGTQLVEGGRCPEIEVVTESGVKLEYTSETEADTKTLPETKTRPETIPTPASITLSGELNETQDAITYKVKETESESPDDIKLEMIPEINVITEEMKENFDPAAQSKSMNQEKERDADSGSGSMADNNSIDLSLSISSFLSRNKETGSISLQ